MFPVLFIDLSKTNNEIKNQENCIIEGGKKYTVEC